MKARDLQNLPKLPKLPMGLVMRMVMGLLVSWSMASASLHAQTNAKKPVIATRDQLRACLDEEDRLKGMQDSLMDARAAHESEMQRWQDAMNAHMADQASIDLHDQLAVDRFNAQTEVIDEQGQAANKWSDQFNAQLEVAHQQISAHNRQCAGLVFRDFDQAVVAKERAERAARSKRASTAPSGV